MVQELRSYLGHIATIWEAIASGYSPMLVDSLTVRNLELSAPGISEFDAAHVANLMDEGMIFPSLQNRDARQAILTSIQSIRCMIPSLRTFFEDLKYLEPCSLILKSLLGRSETRPLWDGFLATYKDPSGFCLEYAEDTFTRVLPMERESGKAFGYIQLWMFCFRHFPEMTNITPNMTNRRGTKVRRDHNPALWRRLGSLAIRLGFQTTEAIRLAAKDSDREHAEQFLLSARPEWKGRMELQISRVAAILASMKVCHSMPSIPAAVFTGLKELSPKNRCGKPHDHDHDKDKPSLFGSLLFHHVESGPEITSLYVKRSLFDTFFRKRVEQVKFSEGFRGFGDFLDIPLESYVSDERMDDVFELEDLRAKYAERSLEVSKLTTRQKTLLESAENWENQNVALRSREQILSQKCDSLQNQILQLRQEGDRNIDTIEELRSENEMLKTSNLRMANEEIETLTALLAKARQDIVLLKEETSTLEAAGKNAEWQTTQREAQYEALQKERDDALARAASYEALSIKERSRMKTEIDSAYAAKKEEVDRLREEIDALNSKQREMEKEIVDAEAMIHDKDEIIRNQLEGFTDIRKKNGHFMMQYANETLDEICMSVTEKLEILHRRDHLKDVQIIIEKPSESSNHYEAVHVQKFGSYYRSCRLRILPDSVGTFVSRTKLGTQLSDRRLSIFITTPRDASPVVLKKFTERVSEEHLHQWKNAGIVPLIGDSSHLEDFQKEVAQQGINQARPTIGKRAPGVGLKLNKIEVLGSLDHLEQPEMGVHVDNRRMKRLHSRLTPKPQAPNTGEEPLHHTMANSNERLAESGTDADGNYEMEEL